ncbi:hypothetical protein L9F63_026795, partial [Diploptera punctata]
LSHLTVNKNFKCNVCNLYKCCSHSIYTKFYHDYGFISFSEYRGKHTRLAIASVNARDENGETSISLAASEGESNVVELLLQSSSARVGSYM